MKMGVHRQLAVEEYEQSARNIDNGYQRHARGKHTLNDALVQATQWQYNTSTLKATRAARALVREVGGRFCGGDALRHVRRKQHSRGTRWQPRVYPRSDSIACAAD